MEGIDLKAVAEGGAIVLCALLIILLYLVLKMNNKTISNHMEHFTVALENNTKVIGETKECIKQNSKLITRVEHKIDKL